MKPGFILGIERLVVWRGKSKNTMHVTCVRARLIWWLIDDWGPGMFGSPLGLFAEDAV